MIQPTAQRVPVVTTVKFIWAALLLSQICYYYVATVITGPADPALPQSLGPDKMLENTLLGAALVMLVGAVVVPNILWNAVKKKVTTESPLAQQISARFLPLMVRLVMFEACSVMGFVLAVIRHSPDRMLPYLAGGVLGFLLNFPSPDNLQSRFR